EKELTDEAPPKKEPVLMPVPGIVYDALPASDAFIVEEVEVEKTPEVEEGITGDVFGQKGGYIHPFASIGSNVWDNTNNIGVKESDISLLLGGGIWFAAPGVRNLETRSTSVYIPGGLEKSSFLPETNKHYQVFVMYQINDERNKKNQVYDITNQKSEVMLMYNLRGGHKLKFSNMYLITHLPREEGLNAGLGNYQSNRFDVTLDYALSEKIRLRGDYARYSIGFEHTDSQVRSHDDASYSAYLYLKTNPDTSVFFEYTLTDLDYEDLYNRDSSESNVLAGLRWDVTEKTRGIFKGGYTTKEFDASTKSSAKGFKLEGSMNYMFTSKTSVSLVLEKRLKEPKMITSNYVMYNSVNTRVILNPTSRIGASASLGIARAEHEGTVMVNGLPEERQDNIFSAGISVSYKITKWLNSNFSYRHLKRGSSVSAYDFTSNEINFSFSSKF
ncbi:outer membrane beta-barrel protein, partial [Nitrospirota bacterium]